MSLDELAGTTRISVRYLEAMKTMPSIAFQQRHLFADTFVKSRRSWV